MSALISVKEITQYPVKSLAGIPVNSAILSTKGLEGDRSWIIVDNNHRFITQRKIPQLATLKVKQHSSGITLSAASLDEIRVPNPDPDAELSKVTIWKDTCTAQRTDKTISEWLREFTGLHSPLHLMKFAPNTQRAKQRERFGHHSTQFADAAPFLICNQDSLGPLNQALVQQGFSAIHINRFRANIVIQGLPAFSEHQYTRLCSSHGTYEFRLCDPCQRCAVITVDQCTGEKDLEQVLLPQLAKLNAMPENPKAPAFGVNSVLNFGEGQTIKVGDSLTIS